MSVHFRTRFQRVFILFFLVSDTWRSSGQSSVRCSFSTSVRSTDPLRVFTGIFSTSGEEDLSEEETELLTTALTCTAPNTTRPQASARMEMSTFQSFHESFSALWCSCWLMFCCHVWDENPCSFRGKYVIKLMPLKHSKHRKCHKVYKRSGVP